jgi:hypothetical protein
VTSTFERPPSPFTPSVITGDAAAGGGDRNAAGAALLDELALERQALGVGNRSEAPDLKVR